MIQRTYTYRHLYILYLIEAVFLQQFVMKEYEVHYSYERLLRLLEPLFPKFRHVLVYDTYVTSPFQVSLFLVEFQINN